MRGNPAGGPYRLSELAAQGGRPAQPFAGHLLSGRARGHRGAPEAIEQLGGVVADLLRDLGEGLGVALLRDILPPRAGPRWQ